MESEKLSRQELAKEIEFLLNKLHERDVLQEQLKILQERFKKLSEAPFEAIIIHENGNVMEMNDACITMFGYTREELLKMKAWELAAPEQRLNLIERVKNRITQAGEYTGLRKDGKRFYAELQTKETQHGDKFIRVVAIRDISDRKNYEIKLQQSKIDYEVLVKYSPDGIFIHDKKGKIVFANPSSLQIGGMKSEKEVHDKSIYDFIVPEYHKMVKQRGELLKLGKDVPFHKIELSKINNERISVEYKPILIKYKEEDAILVVFHDIVVQEKLAKEQTRAKVAEETNRLLKKEIDQRKQFEEKVKRSLQEKEVLIKEVHHRVKNNLQVISSILNLQSTYVTDEKTLDILKESQNRIKSMSFIHESLYRNKDFSNINFKEYVRNLTSNLLVSYSGLSKKITLKQKVDDVFLNLDTAIPLGLIINELMSNALKYAYLKKEKGKLEINVEATEKNKLKMIVSDNGIGIPDKINFRKTESLGLQLVNILVEQLRGTIKLDNTNGAKFTIVFNKQTLNN